MDFKEDISDSDSGIMVHSGPDSPSSPLKDLTTHTRAMRLKHQALEDKLELCLLELRKLCIREAELTGKLSPDYPLSPDEKPPHIRRRIGAAFKLDEGLISQDGEESVLQSLEAELCLQRQILEAARRLSREEPLGKAVRKSRLQQCKREERKMRSLQEAIFQHRIRHGCASPQTCHAKQRELSISDDSSLSDTAAMDDESDFSPSQAPSSSDSPPASLSPSPSPCPSSKSCNSGGGSGGIASSTSPSVTGSTSSLEYQRCPIQNSPWRESSLDLPFHKTSGWRPTSPSGSSSRSSSPSGAAVPVRAMAVDLPPPMPLSSMRSLALLPALSHCSSSSSAPSTPELPVRRQLSQSFRLPKSKPSFGSEHSRGRPKVPRCRLGDQAPTSVENSPGLLCQSSSEESNSTHSMPACANSPSREGSSLKGGKPMPPPYGYHMSCQPKATTSSPSPSVASTSLAAILPAPPKAHGPPSVHIPPSAHATPTVHSPPSAQATPTAHSPPSVYAPPTSLTPNTVHAPPTALSPPTAHAPLTVLAPPTGHAQPTALCPPTVHAPPTAQSPPTPFTPPTAFGPRTVHAHVLAYSPATITSQEPLRHQNNAMQSPRTNNQAHSPMTRNNQQQRGADNKNHLVKNNHYTPISNNNGHTHKNNQPSPPVNSLKGVARERSSLEAEMGKLHIDSSSSSQRGSRNNSSATVSQELNRSSSHAGSSNNSNDIPKDTPSPKRALKPPPPPYSRLVRTPSLKEYPTHASRLLLPREMVCEELKSWHQRNNSLRAPGQRPKSLERKGSLRIKRAPSCEPPSYRHVYAQKQGPQVVILQRAPDGTPMQWFEEEAAEIVSQV